MHDKKEVERVKCPEGCKATFKKYKYVKKTRRFIRAHHCSVRDEMNSGCYHYYVIDGKSIATIYFGHSEDVLESLRFLSIPLKYALGTSKINGKESKASTYFKQVVNNVDKAFEKNDYIYMNFLALDAREKMLGLSGHAEATCIKHALEDEDLNKNYYINKIRSNRKQLECYKEEYTFERFMQSTREDLQNKTNHLKFDKTEFISLVEQKLN